MTISPIPIKGVHYHNGGNPSVSATSRQKKMTTPTRLYRRVVWVLPCYEKPETGTWHHTSKLQVEGLRLVVADKGMRTNTKNAHGLWRGLVPLHLEAVVESVRSHGSHVKEWLTTNARPVGNELVVYHCTRLQATSFGATKLRIAIEKAETNVVEVRSYGLRQYRCCDLLIDADMLTRSAEENLKRKKLSWLLDFLNKRTG